MCGIAAGGPRVCEVVWAADGQRRCQPAVREVALEGIDDDDSLSDSHCYSRLDGCEGWRPVLDRLGGVEHKVFAEAGTNKLHALG